MIQSTNHFVWCHEVIPRTKGQWLAQLAYYFSVQRHLIVETTSLLQAEQKAEHVRLQTKSICSICLHSSEHPIFWRNPHAVRTVCQLWLCRAARKQHICTHVIYIYTCHLSYVCHSILACLVLHCIFLDSPDDRRQARQEHWREGEEVHPSSGWKLLCATGRARRGVSCFKTSEGAQCKMMRNA